MFRWNALFCRKQGLNHCDICRGGAFLTLLYVKGDALSFIERLKAGSIDGGMMNKYVRTVFLLEKTKALTVIKPLYSSISHSDNLLSEYLLRFQTSGRHF